MKQLNKTIMAHEASERFKRRILGYKYWISYEWMITIYVLRLPYKDPYILVNVLQLR